MASRFDRKDPALDEDYTNGLGHLWRDRDDDLVTCAYCGEDMYPNDVRSTHPMCPECGQQQLAEQTLNGVLR